MRLVGGWCFVPVHVEFYLKKIKNTPVFSIKMNLLQNGRGSTKTFKAIFWIRKICKVQIHGLVYIGRAFAEF